MLSISQQKLLVLSQHLLMLVARFFVTRMTKSKKLEYAIFDWFNPTVSLAFYYWNWDFYTEQGSF
jgi:hypothetical protein